MSTFGLILLVVAMFYGIGKAADLVIVNVKALGTNLGIQQFWLGIVLGLLTTSPEFFLGVQASFEGVGQLPFGNLTGGTMVLMGLIVGVSVMVNREIDMSASFKHYEIVLLVAYLTLPIWLSVDGRLSTLDGLILMLTYAGIVAYFINANRSIHPSIRLERGTSNLKASFLAALGLIAIVILTHFILELTLPLAERFYIPPLVIGLLFFSLGTNLPELTLAFRSWQSKARELSLGNLLGSSFANGPALGFIAFMRPISLDDRASFWALAVSTVLLVTLFTYFSYTGRKLTWREGIWLVAVYLVFAFGEAYYRWL